MKKILSLIIALALILSLCSCGKENSRSIDTILSGMSMEEKVAQMLMPAFRVWQNEQGEKEKLTELPEPMADAITKLGLGGIILFAENAQGTAQLAGLISDMQEAAIKSNSKLPLFMSVDQEGGYIRRLATGTSTCGNMAIGASGSSEAANQIGALIGTELEAEGFNMNFAPVMDINNNPDNPVIGVRSFSDKPEVVSELGAAYLKGLQAQNVISCLKHFPGHGDTNVDSHSGLPCINKDLNELEQFELVPFKAGIDAGAKMIMTAHIQYPLIEKNTYKSISTGEDIYLPATLSKTILTDVLREKLGFAGVVVTDSMEMSAIKDNIDSLDAAKLAINAGADILLMPVKIECENDLIALETYIADIANLVKEKEISEDRINESVRRILKLKEELGILNINVDKASQIEKALSIVGSKANHDLEWQLTEKTTTVVKNNGVLPVELNADEQVTFFASYENEISAMEYAVNKIKDEGLVSESKQHEMYCYTKQEELTEDQKTGIDRASYVVISVESAKNWELSFAKDVISYAHEKNVPVVLICLQLPYDAAAYLDADAIICTYNCKGMDKIPYEFNGETTTYGPNLPVAISAIFGAFEPSAKLPVYVPGLSD